MNNCKSFYQVDYSVKCWWITRKLFPLYVEKNIACDEEKKYKLRSPGIVSLWMSKYLGVYY